MPIPVVCASCQTRLNAPDAAAGRKVKCPKCQAVLPVPGVAAASDPLPPPLPPPPPAAAGGGSPFDFGSSPPPPPPRRNTPEPRPAPRAEAPPPPPPPAPAAGGNPFDFGAAVSSADPPRSRDRGRDDDRPRDRDRRRDEDDRPRRRPRDEDADDLPPDDDRPRGRGGRPGQKKGGSPVLIIVLVLGFVMLTCCGAPIGAWFFYIQPKLQEAAKKLEDELKKGGDANKGGDGAGSGSKGSVPAGWRAYSAPDKSFKGQFPGAVTEETQPQEGPKNVSPSIKTYTADGPGEEYKTALTVIKFPPMMQSKQRTATMEFMASALGGLGGGKANTSDTTWLGQRGKEIVMREPGGDGEMVVRQVLIGGTGYLGMVGFKGARKQDVIDGFFNNIEPLSK